MGSVAVNVGGTWKTLNNIKANVSGTWKQAKQVYVNVNGVWKPVWTYGVSATDTFTLSSSATHDGTATTTSSSYTVVPDTTATLTYTVSLGSKVFNTISSYIYILGKIVHNVTGGTIKSVVTDFTSTIDSANNQVTITSYGSTKTCTITFNVTSSPLTIQTSVSGLVNPSGTGTLTYMKPGS